MLLVLIAGAIYLLSNSGVLLQSAVSQATAKPHPITKPAISNPVPPIYTSDALIAPKSLADCIKPDNIIDEAVATCRYGHFPRASNDPTAQGMVTESYMARYKADQQPARTKRITAYNIETATIWQWDGKRTYAAEWAINDNRIDGSSVCGNYRRGSIEYRECRKGAKVYFREKCREWGKRWSADHQDASKAMEQRFCSAGDGFNPLG
ncbi:hypothetical protein IV01_03910 [Pseudomonas syringae]|uniref:Uncharacterized protein n=1 Tax=Pseudomonas syringae TaxID=317 RepID=A0A085VPW1_PSESX|nr:hypothetical protein IV01_03910 [Pseudomonas syringae]